MAFKSDWKYDVWKEGEFLDLWHINHILAGCLLAFVSSYYKWPFLIGLLVTFILSLSWEVYELIKHIKESILNRILDIATTFAGFFIIHYVYNVLSNSSKIILFVVILISWLSLESWGYIAYNKIKNEIVYKK